MKERKGWGTPHCHFGIDEINMVLYVEYDTAVRVLS